MKLVGNGIYLRFLEQQDAAAKLELNMKNRSFFEAYLTTRTDDFYTLEYQLNSIKSGLTSQERGEGYFWGVFLTESDDLIGIVSLTEVVRGPLQSCWLGYSLDQAQNGKGYITAAVRLVIDYTFQVLKLHRIEAGVMPHNVASIRVLEKSGFEKEGLSKKNVFINGKWEDHFHFAIVNPED
jgi:[ribosomal protein S5]-alanine N-acetyltransferase